jgi:FHA domain-containing protein
VTLPRPASARTSSALGEFNTPLSGTNPFANLLTPGAPSVRMPPAIDAPGPARLPDDFDPFGASFEPAARPAVDQPSGGGVFGNLIPSGAPTSLDDMFGLGASSRRDPLADFVAGAAPARPDSAPAPMGASTDPLAMFDLPMAAPRTAPSDPILSDHVAELRSAFRPPRVASPAPVEKVRPVENELPAAPPTGRSMQSTASGGATSSGDQALWDAFCEGAQLNLDRPRGLDAAAIHAIGSLLRAAVDGTMQLVAVRSATRHELHAQVTVIRTRNNNPLKFSPDAQSALEQMLEPPLRGFLPGPEAMTDAMNDLVGHAIGTMAGTRAALDGVLGRFMPQALEAKLANKSVLDTVLRKHRKARLWDLYLQHYDAIREEAQEDFHALFGKAFLTAYEQQLDRLRREKNPSSFE